MGYITALHPCPSRFSKNTLLHPTRFATPAFSNIHANEFYCFVFLFILLTYKKVREVLYNRAAITPTCFLRYRNIAVRLFFLLIWKEIVAKCLSQGLKTWLRLDLNPGSVDQRSHSLLLGYYFQYKVVGITIWSNMFQLSFCKENDSVEYHCLFIQI